MQNDNVAHMQYVEMSGVKSNTVSVTSGVSQGLVLDPLLFILYLSEYIIPSICSLFIFADDVLLLFNSETNILDYLKRTINFKIKNYYF